MNHEALDKDIGDCTDAEWSSLVRWLYKWSQEEFAGFLGISVKTVRAWEQGINPMSMLARRFLMELWVNPNYFKGRANMLKKGGVATHGKQARVGE